MKLTALGLFLLLTAISLPVAAAEMILRNGGDAFLGGETLLSDINTAGDTFVAGQSAKLGGTTLGDLHAAGFTIFVSVSVAQDLYAAGATVDIASTVAGDTTAVGFTVRTTPSAETAGNVRLLGNSVTIEGPVKGALSVMARSVILNAPIEGDVRIAARSLQFGENASVGGTLSYSTDNRVAVPESVASADRVQYSKLDIDADWDEFREAWPGADMPAFPTFASVLGAFLISLLFFLVLGALALGFAPKQLERMRLGIAAAPGRSMLLGVIGLSLLFGLVPIAALTIVGLPFVPIVLLVIVVTWTLGYALASYTVAMLAWDALGGAKDPGGLIRLLLLAAAVTVVALLNFIPFIGWVANFTLVLIGVGAFARCVFTSFVTDPDPAYDVDMKPIED